MENLIFDYQKLPERVSVKILKGSSGTYIAELPDLDAHTEADSLESLDNMINDLIFAIYNVPPRIQQLVRYVKDLPEENVPKYSLEEMLIFQKFISSDTRYLLP